ncbi:MAG TPA: putative Ig domain-containing protein, partial [Acidimicrobiales bacterium]|nr:putative Ig domain-containing protein [Acidimicrobiales bacterium]
MDNRKKQRICPGERGAGHVAGDRRDCRASGWAGSPADRTRPLAAGLALALVPFRALSLMVSSRLRCLVSCVVSVAIVAGALAGLAPPANAAGTAVVIDAFGNPTVSAGPFTRAVSELPPPDTSTTPAGTFSVSNGIATMTSQGAGNGLGGTTLTYTPTSGGSVDLTSGGNNDQVLVDFSEIEWPQAQPGQDSVTIYSQATDVNGCNTYLPSDGIANYIAFNAAFPFADYNSTNCTFDWSKVTSFSITFTFAQTYSPGTLTVQVNRIWATPETAAPPSNPAPSVSAPATAAGSSTTPLDFTIAFTSDEGAAPVTYDPPSNIGLRAQDLQVSGTAFGAGTPNVTVTGGPSTYTAVVTGMVQDGTVTLHVPDSVVQDAFLQYNSASVDDPTVGWTYAIAPDFQSAANATFTVGTSGSFTVNAMGGTPTPTPTPTLTIQSGSGPLPSGLVLTDKGNGTATISGTPALGAGGVYQFTLAATNIAATVTQDFTLTVDEAPSFTSADDTGFTNGSAGTFAVTTYGYPTPTLTESGALPAGVIFVDNGNGTATISGTPTATGTYKIGLLAANGIGTNAAQSFTLTVDQAPSITSASSSTFTVGAAGSFSVTTTGYPTPALTESGALPSGVTFTNKGNGTATLSGTPQTGAGGVYDISITASNGVTPAGTQTFTLTVDEASSITSAPSTTFTVGSSGSFTVTTAHEYPSTPTISLTAGSLPGGITFTDNGNGTATLSGTPAPGAGGVYRLSITAANGISPSDVQSFTLTVDQAPSIGSADSAT